MKLLFKQRAFSWFDSYDIYDEGDNTVYTVKGQLAWGHLLKVYNAAGTEVGSVREKVLTFLPKFEIYSGETYLGCISKELSLFKQKYNIDFNGWRVEGDYLEWNYSIYDASNKLIASISKELFNWTDTYTLDIVNPENATLVLMFVLAMDAEKCSRN